MLLLLLLLFKYNSESNHVSNVISNCPRSAHSTDFLSKVGVLLEDELLGFLYVSLGHCLGMLCVKTFSYFIS